jgi:hypothetical protein
VFAKMPDVAAETTGHRLKVLVAGLHQLGAECEGVSDELSVAAAPSVVVASPWQSNAGAVNIAVAAAGKDLTAIAERVDRRGANYRAGGCRLHRH